MLHNRRDTFKAVPGIGEGSWLDTSDVVEITALMARFAHAIDECDWPAYRLVFADEIELDYSSWRAGSLGRWSADDWVARAARLFPGLTGTQHAVTNIVVEPGPNPGEAHVRASVRADHAIVDGATTRVFTVSGRYDDRCRRAADGWRISAKRLVVAWTVGEPGLLDEARAAVAAGTPRRTGSEG